MNLKIAQLCFTYDKAQKASRDPSRREKESDYLKIACEKRKEIVRKAETLMSEICSKALSNDVSEASIGLAYFNTWFILRGGW